tara:strand:- start:3113 stop:3721 length:609 start_codon:yes stop_codon:yes gene_type:complete
MNLEDRFTQAEWTAQTVNQTVNNFPQLKGMSVDEKLDMVIRKLIGDDWHNEPGVLPTLKSIVEQSRLASDEREKMLQRVLATEKKAVALEKRQDVYHQWLWISNGVLILLGVAIVYLLFLVLQGEPAVLMKFPHLPTIDHVDSVGEGDVAPVNQQQESQMHASYPDGDEPGGEGMAGVVGIALRPLQVNPPDVLIEQDAPDV